jgi:hypothetical protein
VFTIMRHRLLVAAVALIPMSVAGQQDPILRLSEVLPPDVADQVISRVESARAMGLPTQAVANLALEGVAKGRGAAEVLAAVELLVADLGRGREALLSSGRTPGAGEVEAAATAMRMGVDGGDVAALARSGPAGRSLAVPLLVLGALAQRGLPSDQALEAVRERLAARAPDAELLSTFGAPGPRGGPGLGRGLAPDAPGADLAGGRAGLGVPVGPPDGAGRPPVGRGRGGGPPQY